MTCFMIMNYKPIINYNFIFSKRRITYNISIKNFGIVFVCDTASFLYVNVSDMSAKQLDIFF